MPPSGLTPRQDVGDPSPEGLARGDHDAAGGPGPAVSPASEALWFCKVTCAGVCPAHNYVRGLYMSPPSSWASGVD